MDYQLKTGKNTLRVQFSNWDDNSYILLPACAYNGNRQKSVKRAYAPFYLEEERGVDAQVLLTDVPRLNPDGSGKLEVTTGDLATPCVGVFSPRDQQGFLLFTTQGRGSQNFGITVSAGEILITGIAMRSTTYRWSHFEPTDPTSCDEEIAIPHKIFDFPCKNVQGLFDVFFENRKCMGLPAQRPENPPAAQTFSVQEEKFNRENWNGRYYRVGTKDSMYEDWQCGWVGGGMSSYALLKCGSPESRKRAVKTLEFLASTQTKAGFYPGVCYNGQIHADGFDYPGTDHCLLLRKNADALYFLFKHFSVMETVPQALSGSAKKCADAFVRLWETYGQFGQFIDCETGEILVGNTTSAGIAPAALALAWKFFGNDRYLAVAEAAAQAYYDRDVCAGVMTGGPGEILGCPDSESSFGLLESFVVLYEATGKEKWLSYAEDCAKQCASWVVSYNYVFPEDSEFGKRGILTVGSVFANVQNKHSAPGICTLSGDSLLKLYRWTGNPLYKELIEDIAAFMPQCMSTTERPVRAHDTGREMPSGYICERVNMSDWEGFDWVGEVFDGSCWSETSLLLAYADLDFVREGK